MKMIEANVTGVMLQKYLSVKAKTISRKLNGLSQFKASEMARIKVILGLTWDEYYEIFHAGCLEVWR